MTDSSNAVFLSYASQDAEAAKRICEALRAAGIEVWFDQSELRGGDAWDRTIRKQILDCALFIPIISTHSQDRLEGYFRREWKLAADRTHDMAEEKAFLVPVVIDDTPERSASVPEKFREVQWSRLPAGETPRAFVERVLHLVVSERASTPLHEAKATANVLRPPMAARRRVELYGLLKPQISLVIAAAAVLGLVAGTVWIMRNGTKGIPSEQVLPPQVSTASALSIIVLPFALRLTLASATGMDRSIEQAAVSLGASGPTVLRRITLPLILPGLASGWALAFIQSFDDVTMTVFIATPGTETLPVRMFLYIQDNIDPLVTSISAVTIALTTVALIVLDRAFGLDRLLAGRGREDG